MLPPTLPFLIVHHIVGVDVGFENPMFAALEVDYAESDQDPTGQAAANAGKVRLGIIFFRSSFD
jgi:hypothetical protein